MNRLTDFRAFLLGLFIVGAVGASMIWAATTTQQGTLKSVEGSKIVLTTHAFDMTFDVNGSTQITLDGKTAKAAELRMGDAATVEFNAQDDSSPIAVRIDAQRPSEPDSPDPVPQ